MRDEPSIMHLDADAFFASVEQRQKPSTAGTPVVVGGLGARGVVATASYEARALGCHSALPMSQARRACPSGVFLVPRFAAYAAHSAVMMGLLREVSPLVQPLGMDEAFVDLAVGGDGRDPREVAQAVRAAIFDATGLVVSVGLGRSKLVAKLASDADKPHGFTVVDPAGEDDFLLPLPVTALWGVGPATQKTLEGFGVRTVADLRGTSESDLVRALGRAAGMGLHRISFGLDDRPVEADRETKSVGAEETFAHDLRPHALAVALQGVFGRAAARLARFGGGARTVTVKVRLADFTTLTRSVTLPQPTSDPGELRPAAARALAAAQVTESVRLLGVSFSSLTSYSQLVLDPASTRDVADGVEQVEHADGERLPAPLTPETCWPGVDVSHPTYGAGWVVRRDGPNVTVRFEGPNTPPGRDVVFDARLAGLLRTEPPPPMSPAAA